MDDGIPSVRPKSYTFPLPDPVPLRTNETISRALLRKDLLSQKNLAVHSQQGPYYLGLQSTAFGALQKKVLSDFPNSGRVVEGQPLLAQHE